MVKSSFAIGISAALVLSASIHGAALAADDGTAKPATTGSTQPHLGNGPAVEKSLPSSAPPATTTRTTGATGQDKTVKAMNNNAKAKVDAEGK